jgi:hypothetical protein
MKNRLFQSFARAAFATVLFLSPALMRADVISIVPASTTATVGDTIKLDVIATGVPLGSFDFTMSFAPALVSFTSGAYDTFLAGPAMSFQQDPPVVGLDNVEMAEVSFAAPADLAALQSGGSYRIATLLFKALSPGTADFNLLSTVFSDYAGSVVTPGLQGASISISGPVTSPVPEPSTLLLAASLLPALFVARRKLAANR